jgi:hypothetical protein
MLLAYVWPNVVTGIVVAARSAGVMPLADSRSTSSNSTGSSESIAQALRETARAEISRVVFIYASLVLAPYIGR